SPNRLTLTVRGTLAQAQRAFHTPIRDVALGGRIAYANLEAPAVPFRLAPQIADVTGLSDVVQPADTPVDQYRCSHGGIVTAPSGLGISDCSTLCANARSGLPQISVLGDGLIGAILKAFAVVGWLLLQIPNAVGGALGFSLVIGDAQLYCIGVNLA